MSDPIDDLQDVYARGGLDSLEAFEERVEDLLELNTRETLPKQLWMCPGPEDGEPELEPKPEEFDPVDGEKHLRIKPVGGMWTSSFTPDDEYDSDWIRWCSHEGFLSGRHAWRLVPENDLRIIEVDGMEDLWAVVQRFRDDSYGPEYPSGIQDHALDFRFMAEEFDAMRLTAEGQKKTRLTGSKEPDLYGWDSECTLWLRWPFEEVEYHGYYDNELPDWRTPE